MGFFKSQEEILVAAPDHRIAAIGRPVGSYLRFSHCPFYLHSFLMMHYA